jgi:hypothetical protein
MTDARQSYPKPFVVVVASRRRSPKMRTPTSGELGYWGQRNAGTQSPATCNEDQPRYNVTGNPLRSDPTLIL